MIELTDEIKQHPELNMTTLFEEHYHLYTNKRDPIALTLQPHLSQLHLQNVFCLTVLPNSIKEKLPTDIRTISDKQLAQYLLKKERGVLITPQNVSLDSHSHEWIKIPLSHTDIKRTICVISKKENHKPDLPVALHTIQVLFNKTSTYH